MQTCWLGVDGTRSGWVVAAVGEGSYCMVWHADTLQDLESLTARFSIQAIALDIPLGLPEKAQRGGRGCDREARRVLSLAKRNAKSRARRSAGLPLVGASSIFTPPTRGALAAFKNGATHTEVSHSNRSSSAGRDTAGLGLSIQTFHILPKISEADAFVSPSTPDYACSLSNAVPTFECHPELAFLALSRDGVDSLLDKASALWSKKVIEGRQQRLALLRGEGGIGLRELLLLSLLEAGKEASSAEGTIGMLARLRTWQIQSLALKHKPGMVRVAADDVLDALVCATASRRWSRGHAVAVCEGERDDCDGRGLPMVIRV